LHDRQIDRHIVLSLRIVKITFKYSKLPMSSFNERFPAQQSYSNTSKKTVLKTKLKLSYDGLLSVRDSDCALNVDENRLTHASSLAAVDLIGTPSAV